ncbi:sensor histidine kinase [Falsihalocynthiibacter arcticus]|uniref:sensor histidine kinase n=1 Tax=Falsihalocynthiibacter arcticus TaxID=1579316 RepID=UPI0030026913
MTTDPSEVLSCLVSVSRAIAGRTDPAQVLLVFGEKLQALLPHTHMDIVILGKDGQHEYFESGVQTDWSRTSSSQNITATSPIRDVLFGNIPYILSDDARSDPTFNFEGADNDPIFQSQLHSRIVVPMRLHQNTIGSISISHRDLGVYKDIDLIVAQDAADLLSPYLIAIVRGEEAQKSAMDAAEAEARQEMIRVESLGLIQGAENERQRLGMDLHDQVLADLSRLSRQLASVTSLENIRTQDVAPIKSDLDQCMQELRNIVEDLKPGVLQMFGFADAVEAQLRRWIGRSRSKIRYLVDDQSQGSIDEMPEATRTSLFRIVQEAINNAIQHAECQSIKISICKVDQQLRVTIEDDGIGFKTIEVSRNRGLANLQARAKAISAQLIIRPGAGGHGTIIDLVADEHCSEV